MLVYMDSGGRGVMLVYMDRGGRGVMLVYMDSVCGGGNVGVYG